MGTVLLQRTGTMSNGATPHRFDLSFFLATTLCQTRRYRSIVIHLPLYQFTCLSKICSAYIVYRIVIDYLLQFHLSKLNLVMYKQQQQQQTSKLALDYFLAVLK